ncbi:glucosylglycerol hydrolase [Salipiger sp. 1_MG-2023]|uniref:glucosylglycerol hydrolase n=1 Tax=Salipiger sp. 1_MG-2023 TaxID=3062665 RepID=UPI0026E2F27E|nr:glucosylglycerol hydrolase [Salipiger sp. 1_MG-2023]MDO6585551.1 glucosylglycerol hydrolase [Salipiger sp. 1_MG-2023]
MTEQTADHLQIYSDGDQAHARAAWCREVLNTAPDRFDAGRQIARRLGALVEDGRVEFGFWTPELQDWRIADGDVYLEILRPREALDLTASTRDVTFDRVLLPVERCEAFTFAAAKGLRAGDRDSVGDFYALVWRDQDGALNRILDPLASSLPYGAFAPAEIYDLPAMQARRHDKGYFEQVRGETPHKFAPPTSILQVHVPTATPGGTLAALTRQFERLGARVAAGLPLEPDDELFAGYDAVQLLPVEPTTVYEAGPAFWTDSDADDSAVTAHLMRPDTTNWGYDIVISGMATVNPVLLETARPDELVDLAAVLHNFPRYPKMLVIDLVFGHADNQGLNALNSHFFAGPNMYGQNLDYHNPFVRAILLEMQRRKVDFGADGVRVDGAQDFKWWDASTQQMRHDDAYLQEMSELVQSIAGTEYHPWFVFEDGRPWPQEDWELSSDYRAVIENQRDFDPDVFQWGPLTFAHNTPFIYTFWLSKYWRIKEILTRGSNWISGTANHDTLRRGTQVSPKLNINTRLGETKMEILDKAYDNPAVSILTYAALPGVPMDFLNATARASWGFVRNQDDKYGVKVVAEEAISLKWQVDEYAYSIPGAFRFLKELGFETREDLARFMEFLPALVEVTDYDLHTIATLLNAVEPTLAGPHPVTVGVLKQIARAWMDDMHEYCNVSHSTSKLDPVQTNAMRRLRMFRLHNPWLRHNLRPDDHFRYVEPIDGRTVFVSLRNAPQGGEVFTICHMEGGETEEIDPLDLLPDSVSRNDWYLAIRSPGIGSDYMGGPITLRDSMGLVFTRGLDVTHLSDEPH